MRSEMMLLILVAGLAFGWSLPAAAQTNMPFFSTKCAALMRRCHWPAGSVMHS